MTVRWLGRVGVDSHGFGSGVDRETFARTPKPSLAWLGEVARRNGLA